MYSRSILIIIFILCTFAIALFTLKVYANGFRPGHPTSRGGVISVLIVPLLFIATTIGTKSLRWGIGPYIYIAINSIAGMFFYLFLGALVLGVSTVSALILGKTLPIFVPWIILNLSLLATIGGIVQSRYINIIQYTVTLSKAPASWNGKRALLISDTHFGLVNYKKFSDKVVARILDIKPDFVLHAGDFYDGPAIDTTSITLSWKKLTDIIPVFYAPGNHEMYGNYNEFITSIHNAGITVLENKVTEFEGVQIAGITYHNGKNPIEATASIESLPLDPRRASILINHPPTSLKSAEQRGIDLMVSGHTHNGQFWPNTYLVRRIYGIFYYGLKRYNSMTALITAGIGTYGPPMRLFNPPELVLITFKTNVQ